MCTQWGMTADMSVQRDEWRRESSLQGEGVWDFCFKIWDERETDGQGDGPWVTPVTRMKVISLFGSLIERWLSHGLVKIFTDLNSNLLLFHFLCTCGFGCV